MIYPLQGNLGLLKSVAKFPLTSKQTRYQLFHPSKQEACAYYFSQGLVK